MPLFEGNDLSQWTAVNVAPRTFTIKDGLVSCTGIPTGILRTKRQYENFILDLDWRHLKEKSNAGLFVHSGPLPVRGLPYTRAIEVQIMLDDNPTGEWTRHGDLFTLCGATAVPDRPHPKGWIRCLPSEERVKPAGEWNHYRVESRDGRVTLAVNGKVVSGLSQTKPRKGYLVLESEGAPWEVRDMRIVELPSSNPPPEQVAEVDQGFRSLYTGVDLSGWRHEPGHDGHWDAKDWLIAYDGKSEGTNRDLSTEKEYSDFVLIADWRMVRPGGASGIVLRGDPRVWVEILDSPGGKAGERASKASGDWNRFIITLVGDRLTVVLNGQTVVAGARLPGTRARGPIVLKDHGDPIEFANLYIRELP